MCRAVPETTNSQAAVRRHALSLAPCAIHLCNSQFLRASSWAPQREKDGAASTWLGNGGGAWETAQVGNTERIFHSAVLLAYLHRCDQAIVSA